MRESTDSVLVIYIECETVIAMAGHCNAKVSRTAEEKSFSTGHRGHIYYSKATHSVPITSQPWPNLEITFHCPLNTARVTGFKTEP